jgi:hypothetical protein
MNGYQTPRPAQICVDPTISIPTGHRKEQDPGFLGRKRELIKVNFSLSLSLLTYFCSTLDRTRALHMLGKCSITELHPQLTHACKCMKYILLCLHFYAETLNVFPSQSCISSVLIYLYIERDLTEVPTASGTINLFL